MRDVFNLKLLLGGEFHFTENIQLVFLWERCCEVFKNKDEIEKFVVWSVKEEIIYV